MQVRQTTQEEKIVTQELRELGIPANILGYGYLREAILLTIENPEKACFITKYIYPIVAKKFGTTPSRVERAMRHAIDASFSRYKNELHNKLFRLASEDDRPTNSEFIATIVDELIYTHEELWIDETAATELVVDNDYYKINRDDYAYILTELDDMCNSTSRATYVYKAKARQIRDKFVQLTKEAQYE